MYRSVYETFYNYAQREGFSSGSSSALAFDFASLFAVALLVLLIVVQLFIVRFLWNTVLVRVVSAAKPIPSLMYTLGLLVLLGLLFPTTFD
jgi:hypothetical protein